MAHAADQARYVVTFHDARGREHTLTADSETTARGSALLMSKGSTFHFFVTEYLGDPAVVVGTQIAVAHKGQVRNLPATA